MNVHIEGFLKATVKATPVPRTGCLQIRRQLNSARDFRFPCIPRISIESKEFHFGGYNGGHRRSSPKSACAAAFVVPSFFGSVSTFTQMVARLDESFISLTGNRL